MLKFLPVNNSDKISPKKLTPLKKVLLNPHYPSSKLLMQMLL